MRNVFAVCVMLAFAVQSFAQSQDDPLVRVVACLEKIDKRVSAIETKMDRLDSIDKRLTAIEANQTTAPADPFAVAQKTECKCGASCPCKALAATPLATGASVWQCGPGGCYALPAGAVYDSGSCASCGSAGGSGLSGSCGGRGGFLSRVFGRRCR